MVDYGAGIKLDQNFDIVVGRDGDVASSSGLDELEKDLSFAVADALDRAAIGVPFDRSSIQDLRIIINQTINSFERVTLRSIDISAEPSRIDELDIEIDVDGEDGPFSFVIPVS